eukprot:SAG11_NODE_2631_length_3155_cov_2.254908_2_plen_47_part_00
MGGRGGRVSAWQSGAAPIAAALAVLGLKPTASEPELRKAFHREALQ